VIWLLLIFLCAASLAQDRALYYSFDERLTNYEGGHPNWFTKSFFGPDDDLEDGKSGVIVYFGQARCAYCKAIMRENPSKPDLVEYLRRHFDVIGLNVFSNEDLTDIDGRATTVRDYAEREKVHFTPSLLFFGKDRTLALKLRGYYLAYKMRAALEYVADDHYRHASFGEYLEKADPPLIFDGEALAADALFRGRPYALDRRHFRTERPLLVIFGQPGCYACDVFHTGPLQQKVVRRRVYGPVLTPDDRRLTPKQWAVQLGLFYTPTLACFDERGKEVIRIDSVLQFYRL